MAPALVAKARPDGYTLLVNSSAQAYAAILRQDLPVRSRERFHSRCAVDQPGLCARRWQGGGPANASRARGSGAGEARCAQVWVARGRKRRAFWRYLKFNLEAKIRAVHVPDDSIAAAIAGTVAGKTQYLLAPIPLALTEIRSGNLVPLGVSSAQRSPLLPDVPTVADAGVWGFDYSILVQVSGHQPATPPPVVAKLAADVARVLQFPDLVQWLHQPRWSPYEDDAAGVCALRASAETETAARIIEAAGLRRR